MAPGCCRGFGACCAATAAVTSTIITTIFLLMRCTPSIGLYPRIAGAMSQETVKGDAVTADGTYSADPHGHPPRTLGPVFPDRLDGCASTRRLARHSPPVFDAQAAAPFRGRPC